MDLVENVRVHAGPVPIARRFMGFGMETAVNLELLAHALQYVSTHL
jgi:hypothetical protein